MKVFFFFSILIQHILFVDEGFKESNLSKCISIYRDSAQLDVQTIEKIYKEGFFTLISTDDISFPPEPFFYYLHFSIKNTTNHPVELYHEIRNPHLNRIQLFSSNGSHYLHSGLSGDYFPFDQREINNRFFVFETTLGPGEQKEFFLATDKYNESIKIPITIRSKENFIKNSNYESTVLGYYFGAILIILLASIIITTINPSNLNLLFILYLTSFFLFTFSHTGFGKQFLWSTTLLFNSLSRSLFAMLANASILLFSYYFFGMNEEKGWLKKAHWIITIYITLNWGLHLIYYSFVYFNNPLQYWIHYPYLQLGVFIFPFYLLGLTLYQIIKKNIVKYYFFFLSSMGMLVSFAIMMLGQIGWVKDHFILENITLIGLIVDFTILTGILSIDLFSIKLQNSKLITNLDQAIADGAKNFLKGQQEERARLSQEIHDGTGVRLSSIQMQLSAIETQDNSKRDQILNDLSIISKDIRKFSHNLSSVVLEQFGLVNALEELILSLEEIYDNIKFEFDYESIKKIDPLIEKEVYFIVCELINNSIKHSKGDEISLKLESDGSTLFIIYKDNGIGIDMIQNFKGIGLKNIQWRLNIMGGKMEYFKENEFSIFSLQTPI